MTTIGSPEDGPETEHVSALPDYRNRPGTGREQAGGPPEGKVPDSSVTPGPASAPRSIDLQQMRARAEALGLPQPVSALVVGGATWVAALVAAVLLVVLALLFGATQAGQEAASGVTGQAGQEVNGLGVMLALPFQLVALGGLGSLGMRASVPFLGDISLTLRWVPFLVTLALAVVPYVGARVVARRRPSKRLAESVAEPLIAGVVVAVLSTLGALLLALRLPVEDGLTLRLHAAGLDSFFGTWGIVSVAYMLGSRSSRAGVWDVRYADVRSGLRLAVMHAAAFSGVAFLAAWVVGIVSAISEGEGLTAAAFGIPVAGIVVLGQMIGAFTGWGVLGAVSLSGDMGSLGSGLGITRYVSMFSAPWYAWLIALGVGLVLLAAASSVWSAGRMIVPGDPMARIVSWGALPFAYLVGGLILSAVTFTRVTASGAGTGRVLGTVSLAPWVPVLCLVLGVIVEVLSRVLGPVVAPVVPPVLARVVREAHPGGGHTADAPTVGSAGTPTNAENEREQPRGITGAARGSSTTGSTSAVPLAGARASTPLTAAAKRRLILVGSLVGGAVALLIAGGVAVSALSSTVFGPQHEVEKYLDAVSQGHDGAAAALAPPNAANSQRILLSDSIGAKTDTRITSYVIGDVTTTGDTAQVEVTLDQDGKRSQRMFAVRRAGHRFLVLPRWRLGEVDYQSIQLNVPPGVTTMTVNGVKVDVSRLKTETNEGGYAVATVPALPGRYEFSIPPRGDYVDAHSASITVNADGKTGPDRGIAVPYYEFNDAATQKIQADVNAAIDACAATGQAQPADCPISAYGSAPAGTWTITSYPVITLDEQGQGMYYLSTKTAGRATFAYQLDLFGTPYPSTDPVSVRVDGTVTMNDKGEPVLDMSS